MQAKNPNDDCLLRVQDVTKAYVSRSFKSLLGLRPTQRTEALRGVSFALRAGQVTALLGPNGAGKTSLINILCDLTRPDSGTVEAAGFAIPAQGLQARRHIGYCSTNERSFFWRLSARANLEFFAALHGMPRLVARERAAQMLERFDLTPHADKFFHTYSAGMKKRLGLARAFMHEPSVLLLDEPTSGLDTRSTEELLTMVRAEIARRPKTVLWATHRPDEVERLCDRVLVMIGGRLHFDDSTEAFLAVTRRHQAFTIALRATQGLPEAVAAAAASLDLRTGEPTAEGFVELVGTGDERHLSQVLPVLLAAGALVHQVERHEEPMHHVFKHLAVTQGGAAAPVPLQAAASVSS